MGGTGIFKRDKDQGGKDVPLKEPKWGKRGINPANLKRPLPINSEVFLTD